MQGVGERARAATARERRREAVGARSLPGRAALCARRFFGRRYPEGYVLNFVVEPALFDAHANVKAYHGG